MFDILMYLFESYVSGLIGLTTPPKEISDELRRAGFRSDDILETFNWLENLAQPGDNDLPQSGESIDSNGFRIYSPLESARLSIASRGYLTMLEESGILNSQTRELVLDRALALDVDFIDLAELKLIVVMVLGAHTDDEREVELLQDLLLAEKKHETLH